MASPHRARRLALQGLCCLDAQGSEAMALVREFIADSREPGETLRAAETLLTRAHEDHTACDRFLARHARRWDVGRLAMVDRNILRLAVYELRVDSAPPKVVITEAIRLAREFSTAESPRFINGVLDAIARELAGAGTDDAGAAQHIRRDAGDAGDEEETCTDEHG